MIASAQQLKVSDVARPLTGAGCAAVDDAAGPSAAGGGSSSSSNRRIDRAAELLKVYRAFDVDGDGSVGAAEMMALGRCRRSLVGQKQGEWTKDMNENLMKSMGVGNDTNIAAEHFVEHFEIEMPSADAEFREVVGQFMVCAEACAAAKAKQRVRDSAVRPATTTPPTSPPRPLDTALDSQSTAAANYRTSRPDAHSRSSPQKPQTQTVRQSERTGSHSAVSAQQTGKRHASGWLQELNERVAQVHSIVSSHKDQATAAGSLSFWKEEKFQPQVDDERDRQRLHALFTAVAPHKLPKIESMLAKTQTKKSRAKLWTLMLQHYSTEMNGDPNVRALCLPSNVRAL